MAEIEYVLPTLPMTIQKYKSYLWNYNHVSLSVYHWPKILIQTSSNYKRTQKKTVQVLWSVLKSVWCHGDIKKKKKISFVFFKSWHFTAFTSHYMAVSINVTFKTCLLNTLYINNFLSIVCTISSKRKKKKRFN